MRFLYLIYLLLVSYAIVGVITDDPFKVTFGCLVGCVLVLLHLFAEWVIAGFLDYNPFDEE